MTQHFSRLGHTPFWHLCAPKGAEMTSLLGGMLFAPLPAGFRRLLWPPLPEHYLPLDLFVQPVARVALQERIFPRHDQHSNY